MKIFTTTLLLVVSTYAHALYNPKMRNNFGANHALLRLDAGYYGNIYQLKRPTQNDATAPNTGSSSMLSNMRIGLEAMVMVNNRGRFSESVMRTRPVFFHTKAQYDGFSQQTLVTAGYAHGLKCQAMFLFFGQVKGYLSFGAATFINNNPLASEAEKTPLIGGRIGYNVYNRSSAFQFETYAFKSKVFVTAMAHKKLGENILFDIGVNRNMPNLGFSALIGSCRLALSTQYVKNVFQSGLHLTVNF